MPPPPTREQFSQEIVNTLMGICVGALMRERSEGDLWMWLRAKEAQVRTIADNLYDRTAPPQAPMPAKSPPSPPHGRRP